MEGISACMALIIDFSLSVTNGHVTFLSAGICFTLCANISWCVSFSFLSCMRNIAGMHGPSLNTVCLNISGDT